MKKKLEVTEDQVKADLQNAIMMLQSLAGIIPESIDEDLIFALNMVANNPILMNLLVMAISKV